VASRIRNIPNCLVENPVRNVKAIGFKITKTYFIINYKVGGNLVARVWTQSISLDFGESFYDTRRNTYINQIRNIYCLMEKSN